MTINASSRVFIGTSSAITPSDPLKMQIVGGNVAVDSGAGGQTLTLVSNDTTSSTNKGAAIGLGGYATDTAAYVMFGAIAGRYQGTGNNGYLQFSTLDSGGTMAERARIDSGGKFFVGCTTLPAAARTKGVAINSNSTGGIQIYQTIGYSDWAISSTSGSICYFYSDNGSALVYAGAISVNGNVTTYGSVSDYRLKENVQPMQGALDKVMLLNPVTYSFKEGGQESQGFIAHELQAVVPDAVTGEKDAVKEDGSPDYQQVDTSFLVATLTAAIQEQQALIEQLRADVEALKAA
jgi:hypothetical protein